LARERYYIDQIICVNKRIEGRTKKEWYQDNIENILEQKKEYRIEKKEIIKEYNKEYRTENKEVDNRFRIKKMVH
jgi:hypothetical protein